MTRAALQNALAIARRAAAIAIGMAIVLPSTWASIVVLDVVPVGVGFAVILVPAIAIWVAGHVAAPVWGD